MVQYRDLNAPPSRMLADVVADMKAQARQSKTGDHGKKHMGLTGDQLWYRPDGTEVSTRDIDEELQGAQGRIDQAAQDLIATGQRLDEAETVIGTVSEDLTRVETVVIPGAVADLEAADQAAQDQFVQLDTRLDTFGDDPALSGMRQALADAQATATSASEAAAAADQAASAASQAALEAAGIAAAKGRVIIQETEPVGDDRKASNIWIKPIPDDPKTGVVEKSVTYVYMEATDTWEPTTSSELAQAAQNALDAREAAQQAQQRAETAISNAATAQAAAEAAQQTAQHAQQTADGKNTVTSSTAAPVGSGKATGDTWFRTDGSGAIIAQWSWTGEEWESQEVGSEVIANLDVGKLTSGSAAIREAVIDKLWVDGLAAKAVTTSSLTVASGNLIPNGTFESGGEGWALQGASVVEVSDPPAGGSKVLRTAPQSGSGSRSWGYPLVGGPQVYDGVEGIDVRPGERFRLTASIRLVSGTISSGNFGIRGSNSAGTESRVWPFNARASAAQLSVGGWVSIEGTFVMEPGRDKFGIQMFGEGTISNAVLEYDNIRLVRMVGAVDISDGAITAPKITFTEELSGKVAQFMSVSAKEAVITGGLTANAATLIGQTVVDDINVQGKLIGKDGVFTGTVDFENVNVTGTQIVNKLGAKSISADKISGGSFEGQTFSGGMFVGSVFATNLRPSTDGGLSINQTNGLRAWNSSGQQTVSIDPVNGDLRMGAGVYLTGSDRNGLVLNPPSGIGTASIYFTVGEKMDADSAAIWRLGYSTGRSPLMLRGANGDGITVNGGSSRFTENLSVDGITNLNETYMLGFLRFPSPPTTSAPANVHMNGSNGIIARSSSSRRYKRNIEDWGIDTEAVLRLQPRRWQAVNPMEGESEDDWFVGMVAEEVEEAGLPELVSYDAEGRADGLHYPVVAVAHQAVLRKHEAEINELRERIALLEQN